MAGKLRFARAHPMGLALFLSAFAVRVLALFEAAQLASGSLAMDHVYRCPRCGRGPRSTQLVA